MDKFSWLSSADPAQVEELYQSYKKDSNSVDESYGSFLKVSTLRGLILQRVRKRQNFILPSLK